MSEHVTIGKDTPLRLAEAVKLAFPAGGMTANGLRNEAKHGRLEIEVIAGKLFVTLAAIERMRERCRVKPKDRGCSTADQGQDAVADPANAASGSLSTADAKRAQAAAKQTVRALKERLRTTSRASTKSRGGNVVSLTSR